MHLQTENAHETLLRSQPVYYFAITRNTSLGKKFDNKVVDFVGSLRKNLGSYVGLVEAGYSGDKVLCQIRCNGIVVLNFFPQKRIKVIDFTQVMPSDGLTTVSVISFNLFGGLGKGILVDPRPKDYQELDEYEFRHAGSWNAIFTIIIARLKDWMKIRT